MLRVYWHTKLIVTVRDRDLVQTPVEWVTEPYVQTVIQQSGEYFSTAGLECQVKRSYSFDAEIDWSVVINQVASCCFQECKLLLVNSRRIECNEPVDQRTRSEMCSSFQESVSDGSMITSQRNIQGTVFLTSDHKVNTVTVDHFNQLQYHRTKECESDSIFRITLLEPFEESVKCWLIVLIRLIKRICVAVTGDKQASQLFR